MDKARLFVISNLALSERTFYGVTKPLVAFLFRQLNFLKAYRQRAFLFVYLQLTL